MLTILKCQQFEDSESDKAKARGSKRQRLDERDNKEENGLDNEEKNALDEDEVEIEGGRYVSLFLLLQKVSNRLLDLGKGTKSLIYII